MCNLGSDSLASQQPEPIYVAGCPVTDLPEKSSTRGSVGKGRGCSEEGFSHPITSRRPGGGLEEDAPAAEKAKER
jgi:hypothetical protein